jgi:hypothetical protein
MKILVVEQHSELLGRQLVHDPQSRAYPHEPRRVVYPGDRPWRHRIYNPSPLPRQAIGCCTGVDQCIKANAVGNRITGDVLNLADAVRLYSRASELDPWPGAWPPVDTGSSGLAACKAAKEAGIIARYEWIFTGVTGVIEALRERPVGVGTWWYDDMFHPHPMTNLVRPTGPQAGGHQWTLIGYDPQQAIFTGMCWWGPTFGRAGTFRIRRDDVAALLADGGDAHVTYRT